MILTWLKDDSEGYINNGGIDIVPQWTPTVLKNPSYIGSKFSLTD